MLRTCDPENSRKDQWPVFKDGGSGPVHVLTPSLRRTVVALTDLLLKARGLRKQKKLGIARVEIISLSFKFYEKRTLMTFLYLCDYFSSGDQGLLI